MSWINFSSVTVSNGSKTVTVNSGLTTNVKVGDALLIGNEAPVEISGIFATQLILRSNWPNPTATNAAAAVMPTSGEFTTATQALREATNVTQGNFAEMEKWWTETGTVTFKAYDNSEYEVRTAKEMDQAVKALETGLESVVANKIAEVSPASIDWDVDIPFNEGLEVVRGYADFDSNGNRAVTFSRASTAISTTKSGELESLPVDAPSITSKGLSMYRTVSNLVLWSEDFSRAAWIKYDNATVSQDGTLSPDGQSQAWLIDTSAGSLPSDIQQPVAITDSGQTVEMSWYAKKGSEQAAILRWISYTTGTTQDYRATFNFDTGMFSDVAPELTVYAEKLANGWFRLSAIAARNNTGNTHVRIDISPSTVGTMYAWGASIVESPSRCPYIPTTSEAVTRQRDAASIPFANNFPAAGKAFSIFCDVGFPLDATTSSFGAAPGIGIGTLVAFMLRRTSSNNNVQFYYDDANGTDRAVSVPNIDDQVHRFACVYDGINTTKLYVDGALVGSNTAHGAKDHSEFAILELGGWAATSFNSEIANFKIVHRALSDNEVAAMGAAK